MRWLKITVHSHLSCSILNQPIRHPCCKNCWWKIMLCFRDRVFPCFHFHSRTHAQCDFSVFFSSNLSLHCLHSSQWLVALVHFSLGFAIYFYLLFSFFISWDHLNVGKLGYVALSKGEVGILFFLSWVIWTSDFEVHFYGSWVMLTLVDLSCLSLCIFMDYGFF